MLKVERREIPSCGKMKFRFAGKRILLFLILVIAVNTTFTQNYIVIEQVDGSKFYEALSDIDKLSFTSIFTCGDTLIYGGETYPTVLVGSQCWLQKNLNIGTMINSATGGVNLDGGQTNNGGVNIIEKYCFDNDTANCTTYGGFYQWDEMMKYNPSQDGAVGTTQGICPTGWHIPTNTELTTLITAVGGSGDAGGNALKALGQGAGTNTSGFTALLAGYRYNDSGFYELGSYTFFWSATQNLTTTAYTRGLRADDVVSSFQYDKDWGFSIRCVKD